MIRILVTAILAVVSWNSLTTNLFAQQSQPQAAAPTIPDAYKLNMLIRSTVIALNHANATGNYTVLRDLASPGFQQANNAAKLAVIFAELRDRKLDLSPVFFINPVLARDPTLEPNGLLRMTGIFPSQPERINFDILFQQVNGDWKLFGLAVSTSPAAAQAATAPTDATATTKPGAKPDPTTQKPATVATAKPKPATEAAPQAATAKPGAPANPTQIDLSKPQR